MKLVQEVPHPTQRRIVTVVQVKEIIYPLGAKIDVRQIALGDETMSILEVWGAEYQENDCLLIDESDRSLLEAVCARERCLMQVCVRRWSHVLGYPRQSGNRTN